MSTVRLRRLAADYARLQEYVKKHPRVQLLQVEGDPPERFRLEYQVRSLRMVGSDLKTFKSHTVEISLPLNYPRTPPQCRMLTPVYHPNIAPHAICVGDHWSPGVTLQSIVIRIGEMLAYQIYNVKSPLNGEAARWVEEHRDQLPLDEVSMLVEEDRESSPPPAVGKSFVNTNRTSVTLAAKPPAPVSAKQPAASEGGQEDPEGVFQTQCTNCNAAYRLDVKFQNKKLRCKKCMQVFVAIYE